MAPWLLALLVVAPVLVPEPAVAAEQGDVPVASHACLLPSPDLAEECRYGVLVEGESDVQHYDYESASCLPAVATWRIEVRYLPASDTVVLAVDSPAYFEGPREAIGYDGVAALTFSTYVPCTTVTVSVKAQAATAATVYQLDVDR